MSEHEKPRLFFILGRARSGTTLLRSLLDHHSAIIVPPECAFAHNLRSKYQNIKRWTDKRKQAFYRDLLQQPSFAYMNTDHGWLKKRLELLPCESNYEDLCRLVWMSYRPLSPKKAIRAVGDKNPHYCLYAKRLVKVFPEARFIHLVRDPRANVQSLMEVDFEARIPASLAWRWNYYNRKTESAKRWRPECFFTLRDEDLVTDPERYIREICSFLGLDYEPEMMRFHLSGEKARSVFPPAAIDKYHPRLFRPVSRDRMDLWKSVLSPRAIRKTECITASLAVKYNYLDAVPQGRFPVLILSLPGISYGALYMLWGALIDRLPLRLRMSLIHFMALIFRPWWKRYQKTDQG